MEHAGLPSRDLRKAAIAALARVRIPDPERRCGSLSVRAVGRHVPARDDRHGAGLHTVGPDRGRAHNGARRDNAGGDHGPDPGHEPLDADVDAADHPRSRPRRRILRPDRRHACRAHRRDRADRGAAAITRPTPIRASCSPPRRRSGIASRRPQFHSRPAARSARRVAAVPLQRALRAAAADL